MIEPMMLQLSAYMASALQKPPPPDVVEKAKHHILDTFGAIIAGRDLKPGKSALSMITAQGGSADCTVGVDGLKSNAINAAFGNGMLAAGGETDDSHFLARMHPGCAIVPPVLAIAERLDASGDDFLRAVILGYDIGCRLTLALDEALLDDGFHSPHSIGGLFGGTAGCSALLRFNAQQCRYALSYAVQQAAGVTCWMRDPEHCEKAFVFGGNPARNAVAAVTMVEHGFTGGSDPFHGQHNFFDCLSPKPDRAEMVRELGEKYEIMRAMIKKWTVGSPIQATLDSSLALISEHDLKPENVEKIIITMPDKETKIISNRHMPEICVEHLVSLMFVDGIVTFASAHDYARMKDPRVLAVRAKTELVPSAEMTRTPPPRQARIEVVTTDGRRLSHFTGAVRGTPDNPMTREEVSDKVRGLVRDIIGKERTEALVTSTLNLEGTSVRKILENFRA